MMRECLSSRDREDEGREIEMRRREETLNERLTRTNERGETEEEGRRRTQTDGV